MLKFRFLVIALAVLAMAALPLINAAAQTGPYYYCSVSVTSGGGGTWNNPWACSTDAQRGNVLSTICTYRGGTLYVISPGSYYMIFVTAPNAQGVCQQTVSGTFPGYPPNTGVDLPAPVIYGGIAALGGLLLAAGMFIRRKRTA